MLGFLPVYVPLDLDLKRMFFVVKYLKESLAVHENMFKTYVANYIIHNFIHLQEECIPKDKPENIPNSADQLPSLIALRNYALLGDGDLKLD